jgi:peptidoglycan/LPS O-acetylase OafA/YrhL
LKTEHASVDTGGNPHLPYRRDIDGLRAVAVLSVVAFHAFPRVIKGGFVGVDIFFVISGYLISAIILENLRKNTFTFKGFYAKRIARIFPALILVLILSAIFGWAILLPNEYKQFGTNLAGGAGFVSNLVLWSEAGYFDTAVELKPLLHLWSLGVEEQFYIFFPFLLYFGYTKKLNLIVWTLGITFASFFVNLHLVRHEPVEAFYSPVARFWEIMTGSALAQISLRRTASATHCDGQQNSWKSPLTELSAVLGALMIAVAIVILNSTRVFPGWWATLPTVGAALLIGAGPEAFLNKRILGSRPFVFIGLISYPLYLWHWPLLAFSKIASSSPPSAVVRSVLIATSLLLAWFTYRLIERPIQRRRERPMVVWALGTTMAAACVFGITTWHEAGFKFRFDNSIQDYANFTPDFHADARYHECWLSPEENVGTFSPACVDRLSPSRPQEGLIVVWGDSHAARLFPGIAKTERGKFRLAEYARDGCSPILAYGYKNCADGNLFVMRRIEEIKPDVVVMFGVWNAYIDLTDPHTFDKLDATIKQLIASGVKRVVVVGPAPQWNVSLPNNLVKIYKASFLHQIPTRTSIGLVAFVPALDAGFYKHFQSRKDVTYFSAFKALCNEDGCLTRVKDSPDGMTSWDYGHLTTPGAEYVAAKLESATDDFWLSIDARPNLEH